MYNRVAIFYCNISAYLFFNFRNAILVVITHEYKFRMFLRCIKLFILLIFHP